MELPLETICSDGSGWKELEGDERVPDDQVALYVTDQLFYAFRYRGKDVLTDNLVASNAFRKLPAQTLKNVWHWGSPRQGWSRSDNLESIKREDGVRLAPLPRQRKPTAGVFAVDAALATTRMPTD